ncbi:hypothetical protein G6F68_017699 [Rhizopus microsporus]|nr:hypothetical protein G6F68_017699 [Rhizopus microsporus]
MQSMIVTLEAMDSLGISFRNPQNQLHKKLVLEAPPQTDYLGSELVDAIYSLWGDPGVQECVSRANEFQLNDSARYYFDSILRIGQPSYMPSDQDVLRSQCLMSEVNDQNEKSGFTALKT